MHLPSVPNENSMKAGEVKKIEHKQYLESRNQQLQAEQSWKRITMYYVEYNTNRA